MTRGQLTVLRLVPAALALAFVASCDEVIPPTPDPPPVIEDDVVPPVVIPPRSEASEALALHYGRLQNDLLAQGLLRGDGGGPDTPFTDTMLSRNFIRIALFDEYRVEGDILRAEATLSRLRRWNGDEFVEVAGHACPAAGLCSLVELSPGGMIWVKQITPGGSRLSSLERGSDGVETLHDREWQAWGDETVLDIAVGSELYAAVFRQPSQYPFKWNIVRDDWEALPPVPDPAQSTLRIETIEATADGRTLYALTPHGAVLRADVSDLPAMQPVPAAVTAWR